MEWKAKILDQLASVIPCGYHTNGPAASEPTALAGLAMLVHGRDETARLAAHWLGQLQARDGSIGVTESESKPRWPTSLAILLWRAIDLAAGSDEYRDRTSQAVAWALADRGRAGPRQKHIGHDTTLVGWSWAANTHSWLEPTAMFTLALKAVGRGQHPRTREAVRLLIDRQLPRGGCNYGNTIVLGQPLLPHIQPTGLVMSALAGEGYDDPRTERSLDYLEQQLHSDTATSSLCYGLLGLAAHDRLPSNYQDWLKNAFNRVSRQDRSHYKLALIALASSNTNPFISPSTG